MPPAFNSLSVMSSRDKNVDNQSGVLPSLSRQFIGARVAQQQFHHCQTPTSNSEVEWSIPVVILSIQGQLLLRQK
jgi:hypothetical protein